MMRAIGGGIAGVARRIEHRSSRRLLARVRRRSAGRPRRPPARPRAGAGGAASARSKPAPSASSARRRRRRSGQSVTCISSIASAARNWNSRSPPASTRRCSTPRAASCSSDPRRPAGRCPRPASASASARKAGRDGDAARVKNSGRIAGSAEELGVSGNVERAADDDVPGPAAQARPIGGDRASAAMRPVAEGRAADEHRVGLGAQPAHARVVAGAAEEGEAALARVDAAVERDRGVADDLHRPRVICTPAHSSPAPAAASDRTVT